MKKLILMLVMMSFMSVFIGLCGMISVGAETATQNTDITVLANVVLTVDPIPLSFGSLIPGGSNIREVTLTPGTSDLSVSVGIAGDDLLEEIQYDFDGDTVYNDYDLASFMLPNSVAKEFNTKLTVPPGTKAKTYNGVITYTINEYVPVP